MSQPRFSRGSKWNEYSKKLGYTAAGEAESTQRVILKGTWSGLVLGGSQFESHKWNDSFLPNPSQFITNLSFYQFISKTKTNGKWTGLEEHRMKDGNVGRNSECEERQRKKQELRIRAGGVERGKTKECLVTISRRHRLSLPSATADVYTSRSVLTYMRDLRFSRRWLWRMVSSGMLHRVAVLRTDVSEELSGSFVRATRIGELGTTLAVTSDRPSVVPSHPDGGAAKFFRNVGSYKSHTAWHLRRHHALRIWDSSLSLQYFTLAWQRIHASRNPSMSRTRQRL
jgi:hypothetical protein